jgi:predicted RNA-binding Zn-ribbon protein involved in translation (DUF1610 family)
MIPYARSEKNTLVSISDVLPGLACHCFCPACGSRLIARKGSRNTHHFAHYRKPECTYALESSLHAMAKLILQRAGKIVLPPTYLHHRDEPVAFAQLFQFSRVRTEQYQNGIIPDIMLESVGKTVLIEVAVSHPSTINKIWKLQQAKLLAIEIDVKSIHLELSGMGQGNKLTAFTERIIQDIRHKKWLFNPKQHAMESRIRQSADCKKVKKRLFNSQYYFTVTACPLEKKRVRSGFAAGIS